MLDICSIAMDHIRNGESREWQAGAVPFYYLNHCNPATTMKRSNASQSPLFRRGAD